MTPSVNGNHHRSHVVLVVGDVCGMDHEALTTLLLDAGFDAIAVESGATTMKLLASGVEPCVMVIASELPDMTGAELWQRVHELDVRTQPAAVIGTDLISQGTPAGVVPIERVLEEPLALDRLIEVIERYCPRRPASAVA